MLLEPFTFPDLPAGHLSEAETAAREAVEILRELDEPVSSDVLMARARVLRAQAEAALVEATTLEGQAYDVAVVNGEHIGADGI